MSGKNGTVVHSFNIIRYYGDPTKAQTVDGFTVHREEKLLVPELGRFIPCAPYDNHFVYQNPSKKRGTSVYMCTCGSPAVIAGMSAYEKDASPQGYMFVCMFHAQFGHHTTQEEKWI